MNLEHLEFEIAELYGHVGDLLKDIEEGKLEDDNYGGLEVDLGHLMDHLCRAWNLKEHSMEESSNISQSEFERASHSIPNFGLNRLLLQGTYYETRTPNQSAQVNPCNPPDNPRTT